MCLTEPHLGEHVFRQSSVESDPKVSPWLFGIGLIKCLLTGLNDEPFSRSQLICRVIYCEDSFAVHDKMNEIVRTNRRSETVKRCACFITAIAEIQVRKLSFNGFIQKQILVRHLVLLHQLRFISLIYIEFIFYSVCRAVFLVIKNC